MLHVAVRQRHVILELVVCKDEVLLMPGDTNHVVHDGLHMLDRVGCLNVQGDALARGGVDVDLHVLIRHTHNAVVVAVVVVVVTAAVGHGVLLQPPLVDGGRGLLALEVVDLISYEMNS